VLLLSTSNYQVLSPLVVAPRYIVFVCWLWTGQPAAAQSTASIQNMRSAAGAEKFSQEGT
jgi:hypothetical protein